MSERSNLAKQIEEAPMNAWPAMYTVFPDGWSLRLGNGRMKRSNSISLQPDPQAIPAYLQVMVNHHPALAIHNKCGFHKSHESPCRVAS